MKRTLLTLALLLIVTTGCAPKFNYQNYQNLMAAGDCTGSKDMVKNSQKSYGKKAQLLYHLDSAMTYYHCGDLDQAAEQFNKADDMAQELWTKSVSQGAASMLTNDMIIAYAGEDFERALINLFTAFTYIQNNQYDDALIGCRQLNTLLTEYNDKYEKKNVYKEDALGRWISGMLSEMDGEYSDAYIYYYQAFKAYQVYNKNYGTPTPKALYADLLRLSAPADKQVEAKRLTKGYKGPRLDFKKSRKMGRIVYVHLNGKSAFKVEKKFTVSTHTGIVSIAFPEYRVPTIPCTQSGLVLSRKEGNPLKINSSLAEEISDIAVKNLEDRKGRIWAKTVARAVTKQIAAKAAAKQVEKKYGETVGLFSHIAGQLTADATEKADIRCWRTLPAEIYIGSTFVKPGDYSASAESCG
ncbi:MAG: hypothetical protein MI742_05220, partial [Desulfobacterales bacterium]|nr:hypothetical protein [Desulfobacterales bacterium]